MRKNYFMKEKKSKYNSFFTRIMIQSIICGIILVGLLWLSQIDDRTLVNKINTYTHQNIQWESIYISLNEVKNIVLDYIK